MRSVRLAALALSWAAAHAVAPRSAPAQRAGGAALACCAPLSEADDGLAAAVRLPYEGPGATSPLLTPLEDAGIAARDRRRARWAPLASAALPGSGQALLSQHRFLPYLALEGFAWLRLLSDAREGRRQRSAYQDIARTVARSPLSPATPTGDWEYYERMEHFVESGAFDLDPGTALEPEPDTTTYNGSVWLLARQTYWEDPAASPPPSSAAYESALGFYQQRAVTPEYRWSWRDAELQQDVFRRTIARSNDAYRRAAQDLAVIIANHVLSTVDAYVTVRLRGRRISTGEASGREAGEPYGLTVAMPLPRRLPRAR